VYTRGGDGGTSQLFTGERVAKTDQVFEALGSTDELNSHVGLAREYALRDGLKDVVLQLEEIMSRLFDIGAAVATPIDSAPEYKLTRTKFDGNSHTTNLESWIDTLDQELPPLTTFILPSGGMTAAYLHVARTTCRRAERRVHALVEQGKVEKDAAVYLNRLSDYLFMAARASALRCGREELTWNKAK